MLAICVRRGAAFGVSGLVKGLGIMSMKNFNIMDSLKAAVEVCVGGGGRECGGEGTAGRSMVQAVGRWNGPGPTT